MNNEILFYNTLTRKKETFKPIEEGHVSLYSCGPTVYSTPHIGNMRAYSFVDLLVRTLKANNYNVKNLINITDVGHLTSDADDGEDKLEKASKETNTNAYDIAEEYTQVFYKYLQWLNIEQPSEYPKATDHISEQIDMIKELEELGYAYITSDGVYFDTSKFDAYDKLSKLDIHGLREGERVDFGEKKNKTDFALWKFSPEDKKRDMEWESPWGLGFPGWHIECSAMARKHLGNQIDIHTGGIDHIPIHHTNEIAQTEAITGESFVNYWMHVNFLQLLPENGQEQTSDDAEIKMSKSKGTAYTLDQLVEKGIEPLTLKFLYLSAHYRNELKFNFEILETAQRSYDKLRHKIFDLKNGAKIETFSADDVSNSLLMHFNNDLDTPKAVAQFHSILNDKTISDKEKINAVQLFDSLTGLQLLDFVPKEDDVPDSIKALVEQRLLAKSEKDWAKADSIRDEIHDLGYKLEESKEGVKIKKR